LSAPLRAAALLGRALALLVVMAFVSNLGVGLMGPLIPLFGTSVGATPAQLGLVTSAFALTNTVGAIGAGLLVKRFGSRAFIQSGIATYAGANVLIAAARGVGSLLFGRGLAGLGSGVGMVSRRIYVAQTTDPKRLAFANGVLSAADSAGQVAGPAVGGVLVAMADLRLPFVLVAATSGFAFLGSLLLPRAMESAPAEAAAEAAGPQSMVNRATVLLLVGQFCVLAGYGAVITVWSPFATGVLGWPVLQVGIVFSVFGLGSVALGPWLSDVADRTSRRRVAASANLTPPRWRPACHPAVRLGPEAP
jgi:MFS family permease